MTLLNKTIVILIFSLSVKIIYSQSITCVIPQDRTCVAIEVFSVDNVQKIRSYGGLSLPFVVEARWHEIEPVVVMLGSNFPLDDEGDKTNSLQYWRLEDIDGIELLTLQAEIAKDTSFVQLAVQSNTIAVGTTNGSIKFWDLMQEELLNEVLVSDGEVTELLFHPSGEWLLTVIDHSMLFQIDMESQTVTKIDLKVEPNQPPKTLSFANDGFLLAGGSENSIQIWDTESWEIQDSQSLQAESIEGLIFTSDDSHLIVLADATVSSWSLVDNKLNFVAEFEPHPSKQPCLLNNGDVNLIGDLLATTDNCGQTRVWDMIQHIEIFIPQLDFSEFRPFESIQYSFDNRYIFESGSTVGWGLLFVYQPELSD